jgi:Tol biopolymer transport system component
VAVRSASAVAAKHAAMTLVLAALALGWAAWNWPASAAAAQPEQGQIAFDRDGDIWVMNDDGSGQTRLTHSEAPSGFRDPTPTWSPDGERIAYAYINGPEESWDLYIVDVAGGEPERVTTGPAHDWSPAWSPDGDVIAFTSNRDGDNAVWLLEVDTGDTRKLVDSDGEDREPAWSPDGDLLVYSSDRDLDRWQLWAYNFATGEEHNLLRTTGMDRFPTFSPDGQYVLVSIGYLAVYRTDGERFADNADRWQLTEELATSATWARRGP